MSALMEIAAQLIGATFDGLIGLGVKRDRDRKKQEMLGAAGAQAEKKLQELIERNKQFEAERHDRHT
jgi:hypothetical protein